MLKYGLIAVALLCAVGGFLFALTQVLKDDLGSENPPVDTVQPEDTFSGTPIDTSGAVVGQANTLLVRGKDGGTFSVHDIRNDDNVLKVNSASEGPYYILPARVGERADQGYTLLFVERTTSFLIMLTNEPFETYQRLGEQDLQSQLSVSIDDFCRLNLSIVSAAGEVTLPVTQNAYLCAP